VTSGPRPSAALSRLCQACVDLLDVTAAGVTVLTEQGVGGTVTASGELAARLEELQFSYGEGPCLQVYATRRPVLVANLNDGINEQLSRWPIFGAAIVDAGIQALFAFPLIWAGRSVGSLNLYRTSTGALSRQQFDAAAALAGLASEWLLALADSPDAVFADSAEDRSSYRLEVYQAVGMVSVQLGISVAEAMVRLRARAFTEGRLVSELAADIVSRSLRFSEEDL
jgi:hypothetical protein